ncbi:glycosyltransferase family 2 protein [Streptomyces sp. NPDC085639]|uniref:glycosyltransferase family 2 protein n=1 Tax=Streptomyces sp. NPDC085639 TaxID=3365734 RepID=UPI0037D52967
MSSGGSGTSVGAVVVTMNDRPEGFAQALDSLLAQEGVELDVVVVGNGHVPGSIPAGVRTIGVPKNIGVQEGRNLGAAEVNGDYLFFFDDGTHLPVPDTLLRLATAFDQDPRLAYAQPRTCDPITGLTLRRWVPRLRASAPTRPGVVTFMAEGPVMVRRYAYELAGGWPKHFLLSHEEMDLAWRLWELGHHGRYLPDIIVHHPATATARPATLHRLNARNRVWTARRNLPRPLIPLHLATWSLITLCRLREGKALRACLAGFREGLAGGHGARQPMSWKTVYRLSRAGRPPIL